MIRDEDGSITLWMVTASFAMMMLVGLAVDLGGQVHAQQRAHIVAGQAARAGGQEVQAAPAVQGRYVAINAVARAQRSPGLSRHRRCQRDRVHHQRHHHHRERDRHLSPQVPEHHRPRRPARHR